MGPAAEYEPKAFRS